MKIHFIGIGGIGVSALAQYYLAKGHKVSGSDLVSSETTDFLKKKGAKLFIGNHQGKNLPKDVDLVIYSPAISESNPELLKVRKLQVLSYPQALGKLTKEYFTIAVSGTHGKSTTTAMISLILIKAGLDPTVIIGTKLKEFGQTNFRIGKSKYLVIEADEWQASFLNYWPQIIILTNIEREHLDYYKNLNHILRTYQKFIGHLSKDGVLVVNGEDKNISKLKSKPTARLRQQNSKPQLKTQNYSLKQKEAEKLRKILKVPGEHNVYNALAALSAARALKIPDKISFKVLSEYKGAWRRFEIEKAEISNKNLSLRSRTLNVFLAMLGKPLSKKITIISDYAHHPTEIEATLRAVREKFLYPPKFSGRKFRRSGKKIWCIFQPHQYQRTFYLFQDFVKVFRKNPIDKLIITDIYDVAGREKKKTKKKVSSKKMVEAIDRPQTIFLSKEKIINYLKRNLKGREVVIIMGAGDIYKLSERLASETERPKH